MALVRLAGRSSSAARRVATVVVVTATLAMGCVSAPSPRSAGAPVETTSHPSTGSTTSTAGAATTTTPRLDPVALAHVVALTDSDLPPDAVATSYPRDVARRTEDDCRPIASSPFESAISSNKFETDTKSYSSEVAVEPSAAAATVVVASLTSEDPGAACLRAVADAGLSNLVDWSGGLPYDCAEDRFRSESSIPASHLPGGTSGRQAIAGIRCTGSDQAISYTMSMVFAHVGTVVIVLYVEGFDVQPDAADLRIIEAMTDRARVAQHR